MALEETFGQFVRRDWERQSIDGTVRMAVIGIGGFACNRAIPAIEASDYCETTALVSGSPDRAETVAANRGIDHVFEYDEFLSGDRSDDYDAVYVATPNAFHGTYAVAAAEQGAHVLCEKPLGVSAVDARATVDACEEADVTLMTAYRLLVEPTVRRTRELVDSGAIGSIVQVHGSFSHPILSEAGPDTWRLDGDLAGGGALIDLGIYPLNTIRYILGQEPDRCYAKTHSSGEPFDDVDEHVTFQLSFPTDTTASCTASFNAHGHCGLELVGTDGMITISSPFGGVVPQEITVETGDVSMAYTGPPVDEVIEEFDYFGYCVLTGTDPEPDGHDGLLDLEIIEAIYDSAAAGNRAELDLVND